MQRTWMLVLGAVALFLWASPTSGQDAMSTQSRLDTVTVYGMQFRIVALSSRGLGRGNSYSAETLESSGYSELGAFYYNDWVDPVTLDSMQRAVIVSEVPKSVGLEGTNVVGGAVLVAGCDGDDPFVRIRAPEPLVGDANGQIETEYRFAGTGSSERSGNWQVGSVGQWANLHANNARNFLLNFGRSDSLFIRLTGATGDNSTHAFDLEAASKVHYRLGCLR